MFKQVDAWLDTFLLIVMLAVSAVITMTSVSLIVGDTANVVQDKVLVETGRPNYEEMEYAVKDVLLTIVRFDNVYPIDLLKVKYDPDQTQEGEPFEGEVILETNTTDTMLTKDELCARVMGLRDNTTVTAALFYEYPVHFKQYIEKGTNRYICQVTITNPGVTYIE